MKKINIKRVCACGIVAALYAGLTILTAPFSFGLVQFRLAEALVVLCAFAPYLSVGLTLGCFISNLFSTVTILDAVVGTLATALACYFTTKCRKAWLAAIPNIFFNSILVGSLLALVLLPDNLPLGFFLAALQVGFGEAVVMFGLGVPLYLYAKRTSFLEKYKLLFNSSLYF